MALSKREIDRYSKSVNAIAERAQSEISGAASSALFDASKDVARARVQAAAQKVARKHVDTARELGAQWYEYAAEAAGVDVDPALMEEFDYGEIDARTGGLVDSYFDGKMTYDEFDTKLQEILFDEIRSAARQEVIYNLDRDARADKRAGRSEKAGYARVPVGETCAWCFMLASLGFYYRSYESAGGIDPDHYHKHCDCVVVPYNDPSSIQGYDDYEKYLEMYHTSNDARMNGDYSDEVKQRIKEAKRIHNEKHQEWIRLGKPESWGKYTQPWSAYHETLIVMRDRYGLEH